MLAKPNGKVMKNTVHVERLKKFNEVPKSHWSSEQAVPMMDSTTEATIEPEVSEQASPIAESVEVTTKSGSDAAVETTKPSSGREITFDSIPKWLEDYEDPFGLKLMTIEQLVCPETYYPISSVKGRRKLRSGRFEYWTEYTNKNGDQKWTTWLLVNAFSRDRKLINQYDRVHPRNGQQVDQVWIPGSSETPCECRHCKK